MHLLHFHTLAAGLELEFSTQPSNPSYVPYYMSANTEKMNFLQRVQNFVLKIGITIMTKIHFYGEFCSKNTVVVGPREGVLPHVGDLGQVLESRSRGLARPRAVSRGLARSRAPY